ncbi:MAG: ParA family protein [Candidatus Omnitrophica bacterium]|nr:ParA family protein [Candidatus Omnitrophota bacterium]
MTKTIAVCNQKGGVGKTTTAVNIGAYLAKDGKKILLIDLDSQGNATLSSGVDRARLSKTIYDVMVEGLSAEEAVIPSGIERLDILPSSLDLAGAEVRLSQVPGREAVLRSVCEPLKLRYDAVLIDCPPSLGLLTVNALVAADRVLIPVQCEYLALEGLSALLQSIELVRHSLNPELSVGGIILTMVDARSNLTKEVSDEVRKFFKELVFSTTVPRNVRLAESPSFGKPICAYDPHSTGALAYQLLAKELQEKVLESDATVKAEPVAASTEKGA